MIKEVKDNFQIVTSGLAAVILYTSGLWIIVGFFALIFLYFVNEKAEKKIDSKRVYFYYGFELFSYFNMTICKVVADSLPKAIGIHFKRFLHNLCFVVF